MKRIEYKADSFGCTFATRRKFDELLQQMLDKYAAEGWLLHSYRLADGDFCSVIFYREVEM